MVNHSLNHQKKKSRHLYLLQLCAVFYCSLLCTLFIHGVHDFLILHYPFTIFFPNIRKTRNTSIVPFLINQNNHLRFFDFLIRSFLSTEKKKQKRTIIFYTLFIISRSSNFQEKKKRSSLIFNLFSYSSPSLSKPLLYNSLEATKSSSKRPY